MIELSPLIPFAERPRNVQDNSFIQPGYKSGMFYPVADWQTNSSAIPNVAFTYFAPFYIYSSVTIDQLYFRLNTVSAGGFNKIAIYANDPATNRPIGLPIATIVTQATDAGILTPMNILEGQVRLTPGIYHTAYQCDNLVAQVRAMPQNYNGRFYGLSAANVFFGVGGLSNTFPSVFGTWPNVNGALGEINNPSVVPLIAFRAV